VSWASVAGGFEAGKRSKNTSPRLSGPSIVLETGKQIHRFPPITQIKRLDSGVEWSGYRLSNLDRMSTTTQHNCLSA
jgi:hypothetical protein